MRIAVIIVAAGKGTRAGGGIPKQYQNLCGTSLIDRTFACFSTYDELIAVISPQDRTLFDQAVPNTPPNLKVVAGGDTRTDSVKAGLNALRGQNIDYVLIHDGARPFASRELTRGVIDALSEAQAAVPALPIVDAVKTLEGDAVDRDALRRVQTPQGFHYDKILGAYDALDPKDNFADDIAVARHAGLTISFTQGDAKNIKLTYPEDFLQAQNMISQHISITGQGYDVHRIVPGDGMWLCGVKIDGKLSLLGHSDADVALHSVTDAILGALALGDIGDHFPPSEPQWRGSSSDIFIKHAVSLAASQNARIVHADVTLICETPKIKPHRESMRQRLSELLGLPLNRTSLKATTTEGLGFTGRKEGIAAQALVTLLIPDDKNL